MAVKKQHDETTETQATADRILAVACREIVESGANGIKMESVARASGVSRTLLHYHFNTRDELIRSALRYADQQWWEAVRESCERMPTGAKRTERFLVLYVGGAPISVEMRSVWTEAWKSMTQGIGLGPELRASYDRFIDSVEGYLGEGIADGSIPAALPVGDAALRLTAITGGIAEQVNLGIVGPRVAARMIRDELDSLITAAAAS